jgi:hypothetical protein
VKLLLRKVLKIFHATSQKENAISAPITKLRELRSVQTSDVQFLFTEKSMNGGSKRKAGKKSISQESNNGIANCFRNIE